MPGLIQLSIESPPWEAVRRIYRRICELRAVGRAGEAAQLENSDLAAALTAAREAYADVDESALLAVEDERVADARLLAELLAPMLASRVSAAPASARVTGPVPVPARAPRTGSAPPVA
ncbi:MAG TPA: hypothetical protein VG710_15030, partial [Opitutus sp.]|nr:hypothetical protein [Opitutus sp.]